MAVGDTYVFPGFLTPVLTQLFFPKPPTTFLTCFCRGERQKYSRKKSCLNRGSNSQPPGHECDTLTTEPPGWSWEKEKLIFLTQGFLPIRLKFNGSSHIWLVFSNLTSLQFSWANAVTCNRQLLTKLDLFIFFSLVFLCWYIAWHNLLKTILNVCHWSPLLLGTYWKIANARTWLFNQITIF